jgi:hypothetical protein
VWPQRQKNPNTIILTRPLRTLCGPGLSSDCVRLLEGEGAPPADGEAPVVASPDGHDGSPAAPVAAPLDMDTLVHTQTDPATAPETPPSFEALGSTPASASCPYNFSAVPHMPVSNNSSQTGSNAICRS